MSVMPPGTSGPRVDDLSPPVDVPPAQPQPGGPLTPEISSEPTLRALATGGGTPIGPSNRLTHEETEAVNAVQNLLHRLNRWPDQRPNGQFDAAFESALRQFQTDAGISPATGQIDQATVLALDAQLAADNADDVSAGAGTGALRGPLAGDIRLHQIAAGRETIGQGAVGPSVGTVQRTLGQLGIDPGEQNAQFGAGTDAAVRRFQAQESLPETGVVDRDTLVALDRRAAAAGIDAPPAGAVTGPTNVAGSEAAGIQNPRFSDRSLGPVAAGDRSLRNGANGEGVRQVQQALLDLGYNLPVKGADGSFGAETERAVRRFQIDAGLPVDGAIGKDTLQALDRLAPPPGMQVERRPEYDELFADGRLDVTMAAGMDDTYHVTPETVMESLRGLEAQGFQQIDPAALNASTDPATQALAARLGVGPDRFTPGALYFHRTFTDPETGRDVDAVVRVITPSSAATPREVRDMFERAMEQDEVVMYSGHARYGTGPDFDRMGSGDGNVVIDERGNRPPVSSHGPPGDLRRAIRGRDTDLDDVSAPERYQLMYFNGCSTENYLPNLRSRFPGRTNDNTDILTTTRAGSFSAMGDEQFALLNGIMNRRSMNDINRQIGAHNEAWAQQYAGGDAAERARARGQIAESGFIGNRGNRLIPSGRP